MNEPNLVPVPVPDDELAHLRAIAVHELVDIPGSTATMRPEFEPGEMLWLLDQVEQARRLRAELDRLNDTLAQVRDQLRDVRSRLHPNSRIANNREAGIACPDCGVHDVQSVTALTGRVDAGSLQELWGCNDCGAVGTFDAFARAPATEPTFGCLPASTPQAGCVACNRNDCRSAWPACGAGMEASDAAA